MKTCFTNLDILILQRNEVAVKMAAAERPWTKTDKDDYELKDVIGEYVVTYA